MKTEYTVDYFIKKFEAIPDEKWCEGTFEYDIGVHCALGHCGYQDNEHGEEIATPEGHVLSKLVRANLGEKVPVINDGHSARYQLPTPRARILAALHDIKSKATP